MILYSNAWDSGKNIGVYYNWCMNLLPKDSDWCCFTDGDTKFTTDFYGKQIEDIIKKYPECRCFTGVTNRVGCTWQLAGDRRSDDMKYHREFGLKLYKEKYDEVTDMSNPDKRFVMSGFLILAQKSLWKQVGGFKTKGILGVDNDWHWRLMHHKEKLYMMTGVYLYHWYRGGNSAKHKHLI